jgi:serine/threonine protein kinase
MPSPTTAADLTELVRKSGVVEDARLDAFLNAGPTPADAAGLLARLVDAGLVTHFQADQLRAGRWKRFFIGKYKVLERLGSGGMGQVFLAEHKLMRRRVAVKVLPAAKAADPAALERFYREARAVAAVDHPNLVRAFDIDRDEALHFLVLEHVDGTNLHDLVAKFGPLSPVRAAQYVRQAAVGLDHAHQMGLIHRDIKPANLLVDRYGVVKILDMGLARFFKDQADQLTKKYDEQVLGTADFLSPEQAVDSHAADIRADLYALGGTLYYLLTGRLPFPDGNVAQKLMAHQTRQPASLALLAPDAPPGLVAVVERLMRKDPADRYQTPAELVAALDPWADIPIPPPAENELPQLSKAASQPTALASQQHARTPMAFDPPAPLPPAVEPVSAKPLLGAPLTAQAAAVVAPPAEVWAELTAASAPGSAAVPLAAEPAAARRRWPWLLAGLLVLGAVGAAGWLLLSKG